ncbi:hypothetical protein M9458_051232, partial [Cirrhinus mrigala]
AWLRDNFHVITQTLAGLRVCFRLLLIFMFLTSTIYGDEKFPAGGNNTRLHFRFLRPAFEISERAFNEREEIRVQ